jgi:hypothetical protein
MCKACSETDRNFESVLYPVVIGEPHRTVKTFYQCTACKKYFPEHIQRFDGNISERWSARVAWEEKNPQFTVCRKTQKTEIKRGKTWFYLEVGFINPTEGINNI